MEWTQLWAGITFAAQNGDAEGLLTAAAAGGLHLSDIVPRPGGFSARCAAWHYRKLAALARRRRVRLRIQKRQGLFFCIRPLLRRRGLWAGCLVFLPLLFWLQGFIWFVEPVGLTPGQQARAAVVLWEAGLFPGNAVTQEKLAAGEYALMQAERGIDAFQIFDSNAFLIPDGKYFELSGKWNAKVFSKISGKAKTFLFSPLPSGRFAELLAVGSDAYSIYTGQDMSDIRAKNPGNYVLQGNLDPMLLSVATPAEVERETLKILSAQKCFGRHIFNLGHGILPDAKIENVEAMRKCVAEFK